VTPDLTPRRLTAADLDDIIGVLTASDLAVLGRTDFTVGEVEVDLRDERIEHEGWYDAGGSLVAYGWVSRVARSSKIELDAYVRPSNDPELGEALLERLESRGRQLAAEAGHDHADFDLGVYRGDERTRGWVRARGYRVGTTFTRMRVDLDAPAESPKQEPSALAVRRADLSEEDLALAHRLLEESFTEHYGHVASDEESFRRRFFEHGDHWTTLWLAELDGSPIGLLVGTRQFEEDDNAGYVRTLGVVPAGRGRGAAKALLRTYFAACQREGRDAVLLHVDVANVTNALALYESVGMRPVLEIDAWAKTEPVTTRG
jgi:mycothiol synthase